MKANEKKYFAPELRQAFQKWLIKQDLDWLRYHGSSVVVTSFVSYRDGLNASFENSQLADLIGLLKPTYKNYLGHSRPSASVATPPRAEASTKSRAAQAATRHYEAQVVNFHISPVAKLRTSQAVHGGVRAGSGRPSLPPARKREATKVMRVPLSKVKAVLFLLSEVLKPVLKSRLQNKKKNRSA